MRSPQHTGDHGLAIADVMEYASEWGQQASPPEVDLAAAVMSRAIMDLAYTGMNGPARRPYERREIAVVREAAREWFLSDREHAYSFVHLCTVLGLDPSATRARVLSGQVATDGHSNRREPNHTGRMRVDLREKALERWARRKGAA